jgi:hypothetical protein
VTSSSRPASSPDDWTDNRTDALMDGGEFHAPFSLNFHPQSSVPIVQLSASHRLRQSTPPLGSSSRTPHGLSSQPLRQRPSVAHSLHPISRSPARVVTRLPAPAATRAKLVADLQVHEQLKKLRISLALLFEAVSGRIQQSHRPTASTIFAWSR